jgi:hypothetical protein
MKRHGGLWERVASWENLRLAAEKARRGKRSRDAVRRFQFGLELELYRLLLELEDGSYRPRGFSTHWITHPKPRLISAAPFRDRVVHHAVMNVLEPILDRRFHPDSYACRKGKGTHAAADRAQELMRRYRYVVHCDVRKFFPSIDHQIMKSQFRRMIKDERVLGLLDLIVDTSNEQEAVREWFPGDDLFTPSVRRRGLPIGNLTSQWFANWYLNGLDHAMTSGLGFGGYVRYCDDILLFGLDKATLARGCELLRTLAADLRLRMHEDRMQPRPVHRGVTFVGYRIWPRHRLVKKENIRAFRRRVAWMRGGYAEGWLEYAEIRDRIVSWQGHARQADCAALIRRLSREWVFTRSPRGRGGAAHSSCSAGRVLEQQPEEPALGQPQQEHDRQPEQQQRVPFRPALSP